MMELNECRQQLLEAINAHNVEGVRALVHPVYVVRDRAGKVLMDVQQMLQSLDRLFKADPGYQETLRIESVRVMGARARLSTSRMPQTASETPGKRFTEIRRLETWQETETGWILLEEREL